MALRLSGVSALILSAMTAASAGDRPTSREARCAAGAESVQGLDGCFRPGSHVRVESQVMRGSARMTGVLPYAADGAGPAALRTDGTTRLRMNGMPGDVFQR
ncbi:MAG: hypothetical protein U1E28_04445 [Beijerinckiaceae bacterium]